MTMNLRKLYYTGCRKIAEPLVALIAKTNVTPNQITILNFLFFIPLSTFFFSLGNYTSNLIAFIFLNLYSFFDFMDGMLARLKSMETSAGGWLDSTMDTIACSCILIGMTLGLINSAYQFSFFGLYRLRISNTIVVIVGSLSLFAQLVCTLFMNELEHKCKLWSNASELEKRFNFLNKIPKRDKIIKNILLPFSWSWLIFGYGVLITFGALLNLTFITLTIIAITHNIRGILLGYTLFCVYQGRNDLLVIRVARDLAESK
jgi:phosphatidylglycerophosphate synthase